MHIEKLPSGSYRITQRIGNGKRRSITIDHKPTNAEAARLIAKVLESEPKPNAPGTLREACNAYIDSKANILSPATKREYLGYVRNISEEFLDMKLSQITSLNVQKFINDYSATRSPKTTANMANFVLASLKASDVTVKQPQLPQKEKKTPYIPTESDVKAIMEQLRGTKYEIPVTLAIFGLRRSEICALTIDDLDGNVLTINKALVQDENKQWVVKTTKTTDSTRTVIIPPDLADKIREQGYVFRGYPEMIYKSLHRAQDRAGVQRFPLHKLRHFFASYMHQKGYTDKQIQEMGGWKTDNVMKTVYQHAMEMDKAKENAAADISALLSERSE